MGNSITRDELFTLLSGISYNRNGSIVKDTEAIRNYKIFLNNEGRVEIDSYSYPVQIKVGEEWKDIEPLLSPEDLQLMHSMFTERHLDGKILLDTDSMEGISVRGRDRIPTLPKQLEEKGISYPREFTWVDGASTTSGVIELPQDDYSEVFIATDPDSDGNPQIIFIDPRTSDDQERPYYIKEDGKTYIYVDHFSGGGGSQTDPYLVSNEADLNNVRNNLGAYYRQDADILLSSFQTGEGFAPIGDGSNMFTGYYDGGGFSIKDLYINKANTHYLGLFGKIASGAFLQRIKLVNVTVKGSEGYSYVGALVGRNESGTIYNCAVQSGSVFGGNSVGGLIGHLNSARDVYRCYSHASVTGYNDYVGGLIGLCSVDGNTYIQQCLATGKVIDGTISQTIGSIGGFLGSGSAADTNFFNTETTGRTTSSGSAIGKTTEELKKQSTYESKGWDFDLSFYMKDDKLNSGYPENRKFMKYAKGKGTPSDPFLIYTVEELRQVRHFLDACFRLESDLTMDYPTTGSGWTPIGTSSSTGWNGQAFTGTFDGNNKTIGNLYINRQVEDYTALFRYVKGATIKNLVLVDPKVSGKSYTASLVAYLSEDGAKRSTILNCRTLTFNGSLVKGVSYTAGLIGTVSGSDVTDCLVEGVQVEASGSYTGGFVGELSINAVISKCASRKCKLISSSGRVGGFLGSFRDTYNHAMRDCYARNEITSPGSDNGGFISYLYLWYGTARNAYIERCVSECFTTDGSGLAFVGSYTVQSASGYFFRDNFYDRVLAKTTNSSAASPRYTPEMKHPSTFANFDLVHTWVLDANQNDGYPELSLFIPAILPILGFRNQFGNYYTDAGGNLLRYLEYGTSVAGSTSVALPVWLQNNADFPVTGMRVWIDPATVKQGITVELSLSDNPFVPTDDITFAGTVPIGDAKKFFVRYGSEVTVTEGGTFDLKAKASPA